MLRVYKAQGCGLGSTIVYWGNIRNIMDKRMETITINGLYRV